MIGIGLLASTDLPLMLLAQTLFRSMDKFALVVVLFFILCGNIMTMPGLPRRPAANDIRVNAAGDIEGLF